MERILLAKHNATIYGVEQKIEFIRADYTNLAPNWRTIDAISLAPPWGGPQYSRTKFDINNDMDLSCSSLHEISLPLTKNICYQLPKNSNIDQLKDLARMIQIKYPLEYSKKILEYENAYVHDRLKMVIIYFGNLINTSQNQLKNGEEYIEENGEDDKEEKVEEYFEAEVDEPTNIATKISKKTKQVVENVFHPKKKLRL